MIPSSGGDTGPIGVYDSGYGGLTVLRALRAALPHQDFVYLGDSGRAPYGGRDADTILDFAEQCTERLFEEGCRLVVVACHTVSCVGLRHLQHRYAPPPADPAERGAEEPRQGTRQGHFPEGPSLPPVPHIGPPPGRIDRAPGDRDRAGDAASHTSTRRVLGVTIPAAEAAVARTRGHIGVIGTTRTVASGTFATEIGKLGPWRVTQAAAPLLAPIVEEGWADTDIARLAVRRYLAPLAGVDTLVLGCTHYPLLRAAFEEALGPDVTLLDPAPFVAERLVDWLGRHPEFRPRSDPSRAGTLRVLCTGDPASFRAHGEVFLGEELPRVQHVAAEGGRLAHRDEVEIRVGQIVRAR